VLDDMDLEREKGITIKSHAIQMELHGPRRRGRYIAQPHRHPGTRRFLAMKSRRAIAARAKGALLVVDATQGIQAQTISNLYLAVGARPGDHPRAEQDRHGFVP
jgi:GTP-binding protein LepA